MAVDYAKRFSSGKTTRQQLISEILYSEEFRIRLGRKKSLNCVSMESDMVMEIPRIQYGGGEYKATLKPYVNPDDPDGLYWKLDSYEARLPKSYLHETVDS